MEAARVRDARGGVELPSRPHAEGTAFQTIPVPPTPAARRTAQQGLESRPRDLLLHPRRHRCAHSRRAPGPVLHHEPALLLARLPRNPAVDSPIPAPAPQGRARIQEVARQGSPEAAGADPEGKGIRREVARRNLLSSIRTDIASRGPAGAGRRGPVRGPRGAGGRRPGAFSRGRAAGPSAKKRGNRGARSAAFRGTSRAAHKDEQDFEGRRLCRPSGAAASPVEGLRGRRVPSGWRRSSGSSPSAGAEPSGCRNRPATTRWARTRPNRRRAGTGRGPSAA